MEPLVFGLDIGTRNVVGTVGYKEGTEFIVVAQYIKEHETRAMLDGQIHDIGRVAKTIEAVKQQLEEQLIYSVLLIAMMLFNWAPGARVFRERMKSKLKKTKEEA